MNRGLFKGAARQQQKPWVYVPLDGFVDAHSPNTFTADTAVTLTNALNRNNIGNGAGLSNLPKGCKIRAVAVRVLAKQSVAGSCVVNLFDYDSPNQVGDAIQGNDTGPANYFGHVANHYSTYHAVVRTGGIDDLQFKFCVNWTSGTATIIFRCIGVYVEMAD